MTVGKTRFRNGIEPNACTSKTDEILYLFAFIYVGDFEVIFEKLLDFHAVQNP